MTNLGNSPAQRDIANVIHPYTNLALHETRGPLIIERGKGIFVYDDDGKEYIEGLAGLWCVSLGFGEDELVEAAAAQMRKLPYYHSFGHKSSMPHVELAEKLKAIAPGAFSKVLFANSGSEANDTQVKLLWYYNNAIGRPKKKKIISRVMGYHGVTVAAASLTGLPPVHTDWDLPLPQIKHTSNPHYYRFAEEGESEVEFATRMAADLERMILDEDPDTVAAFIAEPIQGAGGVILPPETYFEKIQAVLAKYDIRMIVDEVITGFGRTGNMWGAETYDIRPNSLSCAKALTSAYLPMSAVLFDEPMYQAMLDESRKIGTFGHGYTYTGHPACAAVALKTLELMEKRDILGHVNQVAPRFAQRIQKMADHPLVGEARACGLVGAITLVADKATKRAFEPGQGVGARISDFCLDHLLISRAVGDNLAFCPPLIITESEIDEMFDRAERALDDTEHWVEREGLRQPA